MNMIQSNYPDYFAGHVNFNAVLHNRNSVKEIYEFIYSRYHKTPRIAEIVLDDINLVGADRIEKMLHSRKKSEAEYQKEDINLLSHGDLLQFKELTEFLKHFSINFYVSNIATLLHDVEKYFPTNTCMPFQKKIFLTTHNKLLPCEKINYKYTMGKVDENVEIDIHEGTNQHNFYLNHFRKICQFCYAYKFCSICLLKINNLDKLESDEFVCDSFYDRKAFQDKLYRIFSFLEKYPNDFSVIIKNVILE
jgi:uncharacterized protein